MASVETLGQKVSTCGEGTGKLEGRLEDLVICPCQCPHLDDFKKFERRCLFAGVEELQCQQDRMGIVCGSGSVPIWGHGANPHGYLLPF